MSKGLVLGVLCLVLGAHAASAESCEISVDLQLDGSDYIVGERVRGVVNIAKSSSGKVSVGYSNSKDLFFVEVFRADGVHQLERVNERPFVAKFVLESSEGQKLETFLGDHYGLLKPGRYLAKPVLAHGGVRYEGMIRAFDIVDGVRLAGARQMFSRRPGLQREFTLVYASRRQTEHLFLKTRDEGASARVWETRDLGPVMRFDRPSVSIMPKGEVVVLHRLNQDQFVRTEFWSLPDDFEFRMRESVRDPETAGTARVRELYKEGGVKPKENPWWKFW